MEFYGKESEIRVHVGVCGFGYSIGAGKLIGFGREIKEILVFGNGQTIYGFGKVVFGTKMFGTGLGITSLGELVF